MKKNGSVFLEAMIWLLMHWNFDISKKSTIEKL